MGRKGRKKGRKKTILKCHPDRTESCHTGLETDVFQGGQVLHTYLSTQLFQEGENPQGSLRVVVSSSRKSVKDHYHNRDVARAEGGGTPQYTIHLGPDWKKKKKITRIPYTIKPSRRPSTRHRSRLFPQGSAVACNPGAGSRLQRYSLSRTPRRTAPRRPRGDRLRIRFLYPRSPLPSPAHTPACPAGPQGPDPPTHV